MPRILAEQGIIPPRLTAKALALLKLRSRCQNIRRPIAPAEMHTVLRTRLDDIAAFCDALVRLAKQGTPRRR
ncbi:MAG: hypothetical protein FJ279_16910 [Planctomycetes bacterium]|nr:hypothetical protein [Planctomycetota bacterium]